LVRAEFSGAAVTQRGTAGTGTSTGGTPSAATSGTALVAGDLVLGGATFETNAAATDDTDTTNGSWSAGNKTNTSGSTAATNISVVLQHKIVTASGAQTYNPTGANDAGSAVQAVIPGTAFIDVGQVTQVNTAHAIEAELGGGGPQEIPLEQAVSAHAAHEQGRLKAYGVGLAW
jgi:hypothetical protein